jgi:hypothetical protein
MLTTCIDVHRARKAEGEGAGSREIGRIALSACRRRAPWLCRASGGVSAAGAPRSRPGLRPGLRAGLRPGLRPPDRRGAAEPKPTLDLNGPTAVQARVVSVAPAIGLINPRFVDPSPTVVASSVASRSTWNMSSYDPQRHFFVDPSILLSDSGLAWLEENPQAHRDIVVSANFVQSIQGRSQRLSSAFLPHSQVQSLAENRERLLGVLADVQTFRFQDADLEREQARVRDNLLAIDDPDSAALADEWAYLQSQSWGINRFRPVLAALARAGAVVVEYGRRARDEAIQAAIPQRSIPERLTPQFLARVGAKWLVLGGAAAGGAVAGGVIGTAVLGPVGVAAGAGGAFIANQGSRVLLRAFDS